MVDVNPKASGLQAQIQAQLQASKTGVRARTSEADASPKPKDIIEARIKARGDERRDVRQLPAKVSNRNTDLSSAQDLARAKARVVQVAGNNREAPTGRTSLRENELRNQPLGQIVDIRV